MPADSQPLKRALLETAENLANTINDRTNFAWHALDEILPDEEYGAALPRFAGTVFEQQITVLETTLDRFFYDLVVSMVFALVVERLSPRLAILQLGACDDLCHALGSWNALATRHRNSFLNLAATKVGWSVVLHSV